MSTSAASPDQGHEQGRTGLAIAWRASIGSAAAVVIAYAVAMALVRDVRLGTAIQRNVGAIIPLLVAVVMLAIALRSRTSDRRLAVAWTLLGLAYVAFFLGEALWAVVGVTTREPPWSFLSAGVYFAFYPLFACGVLGLPREALRRSERTKVILDIGIVMTAAGIILWTLVTKPAVLTVQPQTLTAMLSVVYPVGDLALLWAVLALVFSRRDPASTWVWGMLAASAGVLILTDVIYSVELLNQDQQFDRALSVGWVISHLLAGLAAVRHLLVQSFEGGHAPAAQEGAMHLSNASMYLAFGCMAAALAVIVVADVERQAVVSMLALLGMTALVLGRQMIGLRERARLTTHLRSARDDLELRVRERTAELAQTNVNLAAEVVERRGAEDALRASEARLRSLLAAVPDVIFLVDPRAQFLELFASDERLLAAPRARLLGKNAHDVLPAATADSMQVVIDQALASRTVQTFGYEMPRRTGTTYLEARVVAYDDREGPRVLWLVHDVTSSRRAQLDLERQLKELSTLATVAGKVADASSEESLIADVTTTLRETFFPDNCGILLVDRDARALRHVPSYHASQPIPADLTIPLGQGVTGTVAASGEPRRVANTANDPVFIAVDPAMRSEICVPIKVGDETIGVFDAESRRLEAFSADDERLLMVIANHLATAIGRLRITSALRESEERYRALSEASFEGLGVTEGGVVLDANARLAEMLGCTVEEMRGRPVSDFVAPESVELVMRHEQSGSEELYEHVARRTDGSTFAAEVQSRTLAFRGRNARVSAIRDVTDRQEAERRIRLQLERLAALRSIDTAITSSLDLHLTLDVFLENVLAQLKVDAAAVLLVRAASHMIEFEAGKGFRTEAVRHARLHIGESYAGAAALERRVVHVADLTENPGGFTRSPMFAIERFRAYYAVPLVAKGAVQGVLEVFHRDLLDPDQEWLDFLGALAGQAAIAVDNMALFESIQRSNVELALAYDTTLEGWSRALELRDRETQGHTARVAEVTVRLARALGMCDEDIVHVRRGALLHDIGKMGIPDGILLKAGPLTDEEWAIMRRHTEYAFQLLSPIVYLRPALDIPYCHHERWDGTGYPRGLRGKQIPLAARLFAVVDSWDALRYDRPYRDAWPVERVREYVREKEGTSFDPEVAEAFLDLERETVTT